MNEVRKELLLRAMNRSYTSYGEWQADERVDGDIRLVAGDTVRIVPSIIFNGVEVLKVFHWIVENAGLQQDGKPEIKLTL